MTINKVFFDLNLGRWGKYYLGDTKHLTKPIGPQYLLYVDTGDILHSEGVDAKFLNEHCFRLSKYLSDKFRTLYGSRRSHKGLTGKSKRSRVTDYNLLTLPSKKCW